MNLYYLHFNNYYNRIVKKFDTLAEYLTLPYYDNVATNDIAFNPNDGVDTKQVANVPVGNEFTYDYAILADGNTIVSRWFIIDANRNRNGQYTLTLRRDMFADSLERVWNSPAFIEKATLNNNDPMIFNAEDMTFNQIKTSETLLTDETKIPWIVGYLAPKNAEQQPQAYNITYSPKYAISQELNSLSDWDYYSYYNSGTSFGGVFNTQNGENGFIISLNNGSCWYFDAVNEGFYFDNIYTTSPISDSQVRSGEFALADKEQLTNELVTLLATHIDIHTQTQLTELLNTNGSVIRDLSTDKIYRVIVEQSGYTTKDLNVAQFKITSNSTPNMFNKLNSYFENANNESFYMICKVPTYRIRLDDITGEQYTLNISADRYHLSNAPYDLFCIPYADGFSIYENGAYIGKSSKQVAMDTAMELSRVYANESVKFLYDVQLLPYCPARYGIQPDGTFDISNNSDGLFWVTDSDDIKRCPVIFAKEDSFTFNIELENPIEIKNPKIESQCDMHRLCSPNYNGVFEFNAAKNKGVSNFNVDCTYKPYNPYIHINPNFGGLYGQDFNDSRGLVVGGDFSMPQITSAWESYQLSNKNFQASFDRQIQNMEVNNRLQNIQADIQGAVGVVGGVLGGIASAGAAVGDAVIRRQAQAEAIDYTKDQFGYSLGNIRALPQGLSKTTALTYNNKIFPFLEYYTCTSQEKIALSNKIKYNGMTVMRIGTIREFLQEEPTYIKGKFIRLENLLEDFHYVNELANEFNKGVFI